jgi:error-prone DNA polymerase
MGARLIGVTGLLQNEKGVIHIVADRFEDLTPLLRRLSDDNSLVRTLLHADLNKTDMQDRCRHSRDGDTLVTTLNKKPRQEELAAAQHTAQVLPKGRNFH